VKKRRRRKKKKRAYMYEVGNRKRK